MKSDGIEAPIAPVLESRHRSRDRARIAMVAISAVVLLAAGIGVAGNGLTGPTDGSPTAPGSATLEGATATRTASGGPTNLPTPSKNTIPPCVPVNIGSAPEIRLSAGPEDGPAQAGLPRQPPPEGSAGAPSGWPAIPAEEAVGPVRAAAQIEVRADQGACIQYVVADYIPASGPVPAQFPVAFRSLNVSPASSIVPLGSLPSGDWIVHVVAHFWTGVPVVDDVATERFFRFINTDAPRPIPTPQNPPAVPCAPAPADTPTPRLVLTGADPEPVPGAPTFAESPVATVQLGDLVELRVLGDWCAIGWTLGGTQTDQSNQFEFEQADNPLSDPFLFAQNRWRLHDLPTGPMDLTLTVRFSVDAVVTNHWRLDVHGLDVPSARVVAPNRTVTAGDAGCNAYWNFTHATGGYQYCPTDPLPPSIPSITVAPGTPIVVEVPGWTIVGWGSNCGRSDEVNNPDYPFQIVDGCDLGSSYSGEAATPVRPVFLPRSNGPLVRIWLNAVRGDETVSWPIYVTVVTSPRP